MNKFKKSNAVKPTYPKAFTHKGVYNWIYKTVCHCYPMAYKVETNKCIELSFGAVGYETIIKQKLVQFDWHPTNSVKKYHSKHHFDSLQQKNKSLQFIFLYKN